jgi:hypothetical protein
VRESGARNRDLPHRLDPKLDTLTSPDVAAYRSGAWLGVTVTSAQLRGKSGRDPEGIAELAARVEVMSA